MNKRLSILLAVLIAIALLLSMTLSVSAKATRIEVASFEYDCANELEQEWMEGQVYHIRNYHHTNRDVSDSPYLDGINTTVADAEINLRTGVTTIRGTWRVQPNTIDGAWEGTWTWIANNGIVRGYAIAHGTGELFGKTLYLNLYDAAPTPEDAAMCEGLGAWEGNVIAEGYILDPGGQ